MTVHPTTMIQLLFDGSAKFNFAHVVANLQGLLIDEGHDPSLVVWDYNDAVCFHADKIRAMVGWGEAAYPLAAQHLTFALTVSPDQSTSQRNAAALVDGLADALTGSMKKRYHPDRVICAQRDLWPGSEMLEMTAQQILKSTLAEASAERPHVLHKTVSDAEVLDCIDRMPLFPSQPQPAHQANSGFSARTHSPLTNLPLVRRPVENPSEDTLAIRLATQLFNLTLAVIWLPLGAALLVHSVLRGGGDMRLSAQAMAVAGLFSAGIDLQDLSKLQSALGNEPYIRASSSAATASDGSKDKSTT